MNKLRILLLPFAWVYGLITATRNALYNVGILRSYIIPGKSICVGNLSVGGTGKTPHVDYLISHFLSQDKKICTLSRGYGRSSKGVLLATMESSADEVGDEPLMYKLKYRDKVEVIVAESRKLGVEFIQKNLPDIDIIILDDAFQHRAVKAGLNILITEFSKPFSNDFHLPAGNLREWKIGKVRADITIVSKCPTELNVHEKSAFADSLGLPKESVFFSQIDYNEFTPFGDGISDKVENILLVTGIGNPTPLLDHLKSNYSVQHLQFKDHHAFTQQDIAEIHEKFDTFASRDKIILTTEKDYMRLKSFSEVNDNIQHWFYLGITTNINEQQKFNLLLDEYAR